MKIALIYDFDGTLAPGNMQEYDFIPAVGKQNDQFWKHSTEVAIANDADPILTYLYEMISNAHHCGISLRREAFQASGAKVKLFDGVESWFDRIDKYAKERGLEIDHYINSSGIKEMIEGTSIAKHFKKIFACSFLYDVDGIAYWPGVAVNYTNKTQFIFKINKGIDSVYDDKQINVYIEEDKRPVPFSRMIYFGDGTTDIPCMRLVKEKHGHSIAVYNPQNCSDRSTIERLVEDKRVNYVASADYKEGGKLDEIVKLIIDKISSEVKLEALQY